MARRKIVNQVECNICGHVYDSNEFSSCEQCKETKEIYEELFGSDDDNELIGSKYPIL